MKPQAWGPWHGAGGAGAASAPGGHGASSPEPSLGWPPGAEGAEVSFRDGSQPRCHTTATLSHPPRPGVTATGCPLPGNSTLQARQSPRLADEWRQRHTQVLPESSWPCSAHSAPSVPRGSSLQATPRSRPRPRVGKRWAQASNLPMAPLQPPECGRQTGRRNIRLFCLVASDFSPCAKDSDPATSTESTGRQAGAQASCLPVPLESPLPSSALNEALAVKTRGNELPRPRPGPQQTRGACLAPPRAARVHFHPSVLRLNSGPLFTGPLTGATRVLTALHPEPAGLGPTPALAHLG